MKDIITAGKTALGIEFGSTRVKAVLIDEKCIPVASGSFEWENQLTLITKGKASPKEFMRGINKMITELVRKYPCISSEQQDIFKGDKEAR